MLQFVVHVLDKKVLLTLSRWSIPSWLPSAEDVATAILESFLLWALERGDVLLGPALSCPATLADKPHCGFDEKIYLFYSESFPFNEKLYSSIFALLLVLHVKMVL